MLETKVIQPNDHHAGAGGGASVSGQGAAGTPVLILLHGRGANEADLAPLRSGLPEGLALVLPRAPHPGAPWGYGPGWAWYRYEGEDRPETESFRSSQETLDELLTGLPELLGYEPGPVALGGFSQGGTTSLGYALRNPGKIPAVLVFSGFLPDHPDVRVTGETVAGTSFWWGHGTQDPAIPLALGTRGRTALAEAGADLETRDYPMGHGISPQELADASAWLQERLF